MLYLRTLSTSNSTETVFLNGETKLSSNKQKLFFLNPLIMNAIINKNKLIRINGFNDSDINEENLQINTLINFKYYLKKPINVKIKRDKYEYIGDVPELGIYSFGFNKFEVLREINEEITDLFDEIVNIPDNKLGRCPKKWKKILKDYIQKNED